MKMSDIQIGGRYVARVSGRLTTVRVTAIRDVTSWNKIARVIDAVNEATGRGLTLRSAQRLRCRAESKEVRP